MRFPVIRENQTGPKYKESAYQASSLEESTRQASSLKESACQVSPPDSLLLFVQNLWRQVRTPDAQNPYLLRQVRTPDAQNPYRTVRKKATSSRTLDNAGDSCFRRNDCVRVNGNDIGTTFLAVILFIAFIIFPNIIYGKISDIPVKDALIKPKQIRTSRVSSTNRSPKRSGNFKIAAIRVEFVEDTLKTTTGTGAFDYSVNDTMYFDPPPHDKDYFHDHLTFLKFYWEKMSDLNVTMSWDIFPAEDRGAYQLPKQMWQYNYNISDEQLDFGLAELFRDAVQAADSDPAIQWNDYDLVLVFHAGAGAEFDLGYTTTPHDIPSAWIIAEDLDTLGLGNGVPVNNGAPIREGVILPETETHEGVQISMAGVIVSLFGHWLGLPALYDNDEREAGNPAVGKWSLMDRGFGNFYGSIPGQLDAWSRSYMQWIEPEDIAPGDYSIAALGFEGDDAKEAYKIQISETEYFLLSNRARDPENDSIAVAYDRDGRRMIYNDDYTVDADPGFRVPVMIDNLDFDAPGSGILIWHVDEALLPLIDDRRFNSVNDLRGLDLEEADGAQDIGEAYPFLTPGWGTDYGIFTDAWYFDNDHHQSANEGRAVSFNNQSYPASRANSGAFTHVQIDNFSRRNAVMTFRYVNNALIFDSPIRYGYIENPVFTVGNFDDNFEDEEILIIKDAEIVIYNGTGDLSIRIPIENLAPNYVDNVLARDINNDNIEDIIWSLRFEQMTYLHLLKSDPIDSFQHEIFDSLQALNSSVHLSIGGEKDDPVLLSVENRIIPQIPNGEAVIRGYNYKFEKISERRLENSRVHEVHRFGAAISDSFLITAQDSKIYLWTENELNLIVEIAPTEPNLIRDIDFSLLCDFNGTGNQDLLVKIMTGYKYQESNFSYRNFLVEDILFNPNPNVISYSLSDLSRFYPSNPIPVDMDDSRSFELLDWIVNDNAVKTFSTWEINGILNREISDRTAKHSIPYYFSKPTIADINGDSKFEIIENFGNSFEIPGSVYKSYVEAIDRYGRTLNGFPFSPRIEPVEPAPILIQLDDDPWYEFLVYSDTHFDAYNFDFTGDGAPSVWWQGKYRDRENSNAVWEPSEPFAPRPAGKLIPGGQAYCWPNPADDHTAIRYFLNYKADVTIDIFDITGEKIESLSGTNDPGFPNEVVWNTTNIARGAYIAVLEAKGQGKSETHKIKIAVK